MTIDKHTRRYVIEKLTNAMDCLLTHQGDARARILGCHTCFGTLKEDDFPEELRDDWRYVVNTISSRGPQYTPDGEVFRGSIEMTMRACKNSTAAKVIERLKKLYWATSENVEYE